MGVWRKKAGVWDQLGVDPTALRAAVVTGGTVTTVVNPDGSVDEVHRFTANGTLTVVKSGYAELLLVAGGSGYYGQSGNASFGGGGDILRGHFNLPAGDLPVVVGAGGPLNNTSPVALCMGGISSVGAFATARSPMWVGSGATGSTDDASNGQRGYTSSISGSPIEYGKAVIASPRANRGDSANSASPGSAGIVYVRVRISDVIPLPAATGWAQVTGGTVTEYTKPDGSVMEVHTFTAAGSLTVVAAGYADVLLVGGGSAAYGVNGNGNGGDIVRGLFPLPSGVNAVTIGAGGSTASDRRGGASALGTLLTSVKPFPGVDGGQNFLPVGAQGTLAAMNTGLTSSITGTAVLYAPGADDTKVGGGGKYGGASAQNGIAGVVIVAVQKTPPTASGVVASGGTETTFVGDGSNGLNGQTYKVHSFLTNGTFIVTNGGAMEVLVVAGGGGGGNGWYAQGGGGGGGAGSMVEQTLTIPAGSHAIVIGAGGGGGNGAAGTDGLASTLGSLLAGIGGGGGGGENTQLNGRPGGSGGGGAGGNYGNGSGGAAQFAGNPGAPTQGRGGGAGTAGASGGLGKASSITGTAVTYCAGGSAGDGNPSSAAPANLGRGGQGGGGSAANEPGGAGGSGIIVVRYRIAS